MSNLTPKCQYCNNRLNLITGKEMYPHLPKLKKKYFYKCNPCQAWVGCHPNSKRPLGIAANAELRKMKSAAHKAFDPIWKELPLTRSEAYARLAKKFGKDEVHIGEMSVDECNLAIKYSKEIIDELESGFAKRIKRLL